MTNKEIIKELFEEACYTNNYNCAKMWAPIATNNMKDKSVLTSGAIKCLLNFGKTRLVDMLLDLGADTTDVTLGQYLQMECAKV
jgi:hypothetical protein